MTGDYKTPTTADSTTADSMKPGKIVPGVTPGTSTLGSAGTSSAAATGSRRHEAWQPRVQKDPPFNAFETDGARSPDVSSPSSTIRDPERDTAPLQGERDISDSDSLSNEYTPNQDRPVRGGDTPVNDRGGQS
ncbi:MAG TPA: hypothetical protein VID71_01930 [Steroidobacteraceae bacterium]|jgi:hypothetical protein